MDKLQTILIVEDSPTMLSMLSNILSRAGYNVLTSENGKNAIKSTKENHPDVVLLDLMLPDINGDEALRKIKQIDVNIPVIICSSNTYIKSATEAMKYGAYDYIMKPFDNTQLIKMVKEALLAPKVEMITGNIRKRFERRDGVERRKFHGKEDIRRRHKQRRKDWISEAEARKKNILPLFLTGGVALIIIILYLLLG